MFLTIGAGCNLLASVGVLPVVLSLIRRPAASITEAVGKASAA